MNISSCCIQSVEPGTGTVSFRGDSEECITRQARGSPSRGRGMSVCPAPHIGGLRGQSQGTSCKASRPGGVGMMLGNTESALGGRDPFGELRGPGIGTQKEGPSPKCSQCRHQKASTGPGQRRKKPFACTMCGPGPAAGLWPGFLECWQAPLWPGPSLPSLDLSFPIYALVREREGHRASSAF